MSKRAPGFEKRPRDFYPTPYKAVQPLLPHIKHIVGFCEPCAGDGELIEHLEGAAGLICFCPLDIEPRADYITKFDANLMTGEMLEHCQAIITNPPYTWSVLKPLMDRWIELKTTILLLPADFMHNQRFSPYLVKCEKIVSVGRVKWIEDSKHVGVDNYAWFFFNKDNNKPTTFIGR